MSRMMTGLVLHLALAAGMFMVPAGCGRPTTLDGEDIGQELPAEGRSAESALRAFLESEYPEVRKLRKTLEGRDLFHGRRGKIGEEMWVLGWWLIRRRPSGLAATASLPIYQSDKEVENYMIEVSLERKDGGFIVADWSARLVSAFREE
jgi:hypothetical protein